MRRLLFLFLPIISAAYILLPSEASAQGTTVLDSLVAADTTDVGPIPIASIATEAVDASVELRAMREHAEPDPEDGDGSEHLDEGEAIVAGAEPG